MREERPSRLPAHIPYQTIALTHFCPESYALSLGHEEGRDASGRVTLKVRCVEGVLRREYSGGTRCLRERGVGGRDERLGV